MVVKVKTLGVLKKYLSDEKEITLNDNATSLKNLAAEILNIPATETGVCFVVNGRVQRNTYTITNNDSIVVLKMGGAG